MIEQAQSNDIPHALELLLVAITIEDAPAGDRLTIARRLVESIRAYPPSAHPGLYGPSSREAPEEYLAIERALEELQPVIQFLRRHRPDR